MSDELALYLLNMLLRRVSHVFVVGHGAESLGHYEGVSHVDLCTYASLIQQPECRVVVGSMTGPIQLAGLIGRGPLFLILNNCGYDVSEYDNPICMGQCVRLSESQFVFFWPSEFLAGVAAAVKNI